jgi:hypothetical protein
MRKYLLIATGAVLICFFAIAVYLTVFPIWIVLSPKPSPKDQARFEARIIAKEATAYVSDYGFPQDLNTLPKKLFGDNPDRVSYLHADAFKTNAFGQIIDPMGVPYLIEVKNKTVVVKSTELGVEEAP